MSPEEALARFAAADTTPEVRHDALTALITHKVLPRSADDQAIIDGRQHWLLLATSQGDSPYRLLAIAELVRLTQVVRRWAVDIGRELESAFAEKLPPMQLLSDADDRLNLARACAQASALWLPAYLAQGIAEEEAGEKARSEAISALLGRSDSLAQAFSALSYAFEALKPQTESPGDTVARRLTRTLVAVRSSLLESDLDAGESLGRALQNLIAAPLAASGRPREEKVQVELSREVLLTVHDIVRTRISVVTDPEVYGVVQYCRRLCGGGAWPADLERPIQRLLTHVTEALLLLGRQGQCDQQLLGQLDVLVNYKERARVLARQLASQHPELPENVRDWLAHGRQRTIRSASDTSMETALGRSDESVGLALNSAREVRRLSDGLREPLAASLDVYEPALATAMRELFNRLRGLTVEVEQIATLRGLDLHGTPGTEIDMSPKYFDVIGGTPRQRMRVLQPAVVRLRSDRTIGDVITKGLVE
jgi:hypothetical protein